ncbi:aspartate/glutamate racemase family protein [Pseudoruegeria sp. SK021]|uniref:aspartate/glutamate racemase family protein n=1 Tax=Pseudoruegeria sp. SK021 TaxID=1933035 RepID=UPI000A231070|nr:aspartate/glutamate racemase family protein [Pseudoruegeria sp. SK021]OSP55408.1 HyuE hydantoin racemase [Pseudoruegeria sp. SK021]
MSTILINPNSTKAMTARIVQTARDAAPYQTFDGWTSHLGPASIQGPEDGAAAVPPLLRLVDDASAAGADGIIIACFDDTGLAEARARAACPVIGIGQAAYHLAALTGQRFSVVTTLGVSVPILEDNIRAEGLWHACGRVRASEVPVLALESGASDVIAAVISHCRAALSEDGVDCIILGCAGMSEVVDAVRAAIDAPIIDPVAAAAQVSAAARQFRV